MTDYLLLHLMKTLESQENPNNENVKTDFNLKDAIVKDLKIYGSYEVTVNSRETRRAISLPQPSSYNDYVEFTIPTGFTLTVSFLKVNQHIQNSLY